MKQSVRIYRNIKGVKFKHLTQPKTRWSGYCDRESWGDENDRHIQCNKQCGMCSSMKEDMIPFALLAGEQKKDGDKSLSNTLQILNH